MMGRPSLKIGEYGKIKTTKVRKDNYTSKANVRDADGELRPVVASGKTIREAEANLRLKLAKRGRNPTGEITGATLFKDAARIWVERAEIDANTDGGGRRPQTVRKYKRLLVTSILPTIGLIPLEEISVSTLESLIQGYIKDGHPNKALKVRQILSLVFKYAYNMEAIASNPVPKTTKPPKKKPAPKSLPHKTVISVRNAVYLYRNDGRTYLGPKPDRNLPVGFDVMLGSGIRIGECLALLGRDVFFEDREDPDGRVAILVNGTLVEGGNYKIMRQDSPKSERGVRAIILPPFAAKSLRSLILDKGVGEAQPVFSTRKGTFMHPNNWRRSFNTAMKAYGIKDADDIHPHLLRSTVATQLSRGGHDSTTTSRVLGNRREISEKYYIEHDWNTPDVLEVLQKFVDSESQEDAGYAIFRKTAA